MKQPIFEVDTRYEVWKQDRHGLRPVGSEYGQATAWQVHAEAVAEEAENARMEVRPVHAQFYVVRRTVNREVIERTTGHTYRDDIVYDDEGNQMSWDVRTCHCSEPWRHG